MIFLYRRATRRNGSTFHTAKHRAVFQPRLSTTALYSFVVKLCRKTVRQDLVWDLEGKESWGRLRKKGARNGVDGDVIGLFLYAFEPGTNIFVFRKLKTSFGSAVCVGVEPDIGDGVALGHKE